MPPNTEVSTYSSRFSGRR